MANVKTAAKKGRKKRAETELKKENKAISSMGPKWNKTRNIYIAMENLNVNFKWDENEVFGVEAQVNEGKDLEYMVGSFKRPPDDLRVLIFELALLGRIKQLPKGF
jgi:hypothetical protein